MNCGGLTLAGCQLSTQAAVSLPSSAGWGKKYNAGLMGRDKDREITQQLPSWAKQTQLGEISIIYYQSNQSRIMRNKPKPETHLPPTPPFFLGLTSPPVFSPSSSPAAQGCRERGWGQSITLCLCCSPLLRDRVLTPLPLLPAVGPSGTAGSSGESPRRGSQALPQLLLPARAARGSQASFGHPPAPGPSRGCRWGSAPPGPPWAGGTACLTVGFTTGCRGISAAGAWSPPSCLLLPHWPLVPAELCSHIFSLLSPAAIAVAQVFSPLFKIHYLRGATTADGLSLGQWWVPLGAGWHCSIRPTGSF